MNEYEDSLNTTFSVEQKEKIKLIRNTKGYNWEITQLSLDIDELERLNNIMLIKFGDRNKTKEIEL